MAFTQPTKAFTWDNLNSSTMDKFDKKLKDTIFKKYVLLQKLMEKKKTYDGGIYVSEPLTVEEGDGSFYRGFQNLNPTDKENFVTAQYLPTNLQVNISISYTEDLQNRGPAQIFDLMGAKFEVAKMTMRKKLTTTDAGLFSAGLATGKAIMGLQAAVADDPTSDPGAGAYGGITRVGATQVPWRNMFSNQTASNLAGLTMGKLQALWGQVTEQEIQPTIITCTQLIYNKVYEIADAIQRNGNELAKKMGMTSIDFNGIPLMVDKNCLAAHLYMLNTDFIYLKTHVADNMKAHPFVIGTDQLVKTKYITWTGQLVCSNPRYQAVMFNLS